MKQSLVVLQAFRGLAAVLVVVFHVSHSIFGQAKYWLARPFGDVFEFGHAGVEFFFVLSGFIIYFVHRRDIGQPGRLRHFAWKRIRRIYPTYWVVLLLVTPVFYVFAATGTGVERLPSVWVDSLLLVHVLRGGGEVLSVSWTLFHEVLFYGVFALSIASRRLGAVAFLAWMAACAGVYGWGGDLPEAVLFYLSPLHLLFAMGMGAAWMVGRGRVAAPGLLAVLGAGIFAAVAVAKVWAAPVSDDTLSLGYGLGSAILLVGAVELERRGRLVVPGFLAFLGDASYSVYLVHVVALSIAAKLLRRLADSGVALPPALVFVALAAGGVAAGLAFHVVVETRLLNFLGRRSAFLLSNRKKAVLF